MKDFVKINKKKFIHYCKQQGFLFEKICKKTITGEWSYQWASDRFYIRLDPSQNTSSFLNHTFYIYHDHPEFSGWKLVRKNEKNK